MCSFAVRSCSGCINPDPSFKIQRYMHLEQIGCLESLECATTVFKVAKQITCTDRAPLPEQSVQTITSRYYHVVPILYFLVP